MSMDGIPQNQAKTNVPVLVTIELYSDIHCPWAYMALYRLRKVWPEYEGKARIAFRSLSLELRNERPTPKDILDIETVLMARQEPELPIWPWKGLSWRFVPTLLPAFEAQKAAERQGDEAAREFAWHVRHAFFAESRTICMRFVLAQVAQEAGLDADRFLRDWDSGEARAQVLAESRRGWDELHVPGSPTFVLPSGRQVPNPGADRVTWSEDHLSVERIEKADCPNGDCLQPFREMLDEAIGG